MERRSEVIREQKLRQIEFHHESRELFVRPRPASAAKAGDAGMRDQHVAAALTALLSASRRSRGESKRERKRQTDKESR